MRKLPSGGENSPKDGSLLIKQMLLLKEKGHEFVGWKADHYGKFAVEMIEKESRLHFLLTSRGVEPWHDIVSFQSRLTREWKTLHVLGIQPEKSNPLFLCFDNERVLLDNAGLSNYKHDIEMINFKVDLGIEWDPDQSILPVWEKLKVSTVLFKRGSLLNWITADAK